MSSQIVDIRSLKRRPLGGLDVERFYQTQLFRTNSDDWSYRYGFTDIINSYSDDADIIKVTSVATDVGLRPLAFTQIERYFLIKSNGKAIALCRRIVSSETSPLLQSYVIGLDKVLSQKYRSRVYPFSTRRSFDNYKEHANDTFTPVIFRGNDLSAPRHFMMSEETGGGMEWLDKLALQGWFPSHVLETLYIEPPEHVGWTPQSAYFPEITDKITRQNSIRLESGTTLSEEVAYTVGESLLHDYKVVIELDSDFGRDIPKIVDFEFYDPKEGEVYKLEEFDNDTRLDEETLMVNFIDKSISKIRAEAREEFDTLYFYRCLNDLVYIVLKDSRRGTFCAHMVFDFSKHLLVHYGFIDIPISALE